MERDPPGRAAGAGPKPSSRTKPVQPRAEHSANKAFRKASVQSLNGDDLMETPAPDFLCTTTLQKPRVSRRFSFARSARPPSLSPLPLPQIPLPTSAAPPSSSVPRRQSNHPCPSPPAARVPGTGRWNFPVLPSLFQRCDRDSPAPLRLRLRRPVFIRSRWSYQCSPLHSHGFELIRSSGVPVESALTARATGRASRRRAGRRF